MTDKENDKGSYNVTNQKVAVIVPFYTNKLTKLQQISLHNCIHILRKYSIIIVVPEKMKECHYPQEEGLLFEKVPDSWLECIDSYNGMMLNTDFYERFDQYEYILIHQLDAFVFSDRLEEFCDYQYDYIGAPWLNGYKKLTDSYDNGVLHVGNGGFSLRNVEACINVLTEKKEIDTSIHEDLFWGSCDDKDFRVAPIDIALDFSFEQYVEEAYQRNQHKLPFGCHAWEKYNFTFWKPFLEKRGYFVSDELIQLNYEDIYISSNNRQFEASVKQLQRVLKKLFNNNRDCIVIYGAGCWGKECGWLLRRSGVSNLIYVDNNELLWGTNLWEVPIMSVKKITAQKTKYNIIVAVKQSNDIIKQLQELGFVYNKDFVYYSDLTNCILSEMEKKK